MRILLAAKHAPHGSRPIGGVQSWCRTVGNELARRGHEVESWGPEQPLPVDAFDLGVIANVSDTGKVLGLCRERVIVSHGIIPAENTARGQRPGDPMCYTSEEVRDHWGGSGAVLRQPIDLTFWSPGPTSVPKKYLTRFSYRGGLRFIPSLAREIKLEYRHVRNLEARAVRDILRLSACVLATGRAALEAMACGAPVVLCDHRSAYQGPLMDLDLTGAPSRNYSGRGGITPTLHSVREAIKSSVKHGGRRRYVEDNHNVVDIADQILELVA
jgi:hypothetical protein